MFLLNSWLNHFTETPNKLGVRLIPKLQRQFA